MASRDLTTAMQTELAAAKLRPVIFYEGEFNASGSPDIGILNLCTGVGSVTWNGKTWTGGGQLLSISPIDESARIEANGFKVTMTGMPSDKISLALASIRQGRYGKLWLGCLEDTAYLSLPGSAGNYASTPDSAANSITGDIDIRVKVAMDDWTPAAITELVNKYQSSPAQHSWTLDIQTNGRPRFDYSINGSANFADSATAAPSVSDGGVLWLRLTVDVDDGAGNHVVNFYTSSDGITWTQLGSTVTTAGTISIFDGSARIEIGSLDGATNMLSGKVYRAQIYNGIAGTLAVDFDPTRMSANNTGTMTTGEVWTVNQSGAPTAQIVTVAPSLIADPYLIAQGRIDISQIEDSGGECTISVQYESRLVDLFKPRIRRFTDEDQQIDYPTDVGFNQVAGLQDKLLLWGGPGAAASPVAVGNPYITAPSPDNDP